MKILAVTGRLAQGMVREQARGSDVLVLDTDIAAFITPEMLKRAGPRGYDLILIPGAVTADFRSVEKELGATIRLGPKNAADLGLVLDHLGEIELSRSVPACMLLESALKSKARALVDDLESRASFSLSIKGVKIGGQSRMKVLAEVVDATRLSRDDLGERISRFQAEGADMIDLGLPLDARPDQVAFALKAAREVTDLPISIDTLDPELILAGVEAGADLILSLDGRNLPLVGRAVADRGLPAVVIPGPGAIGDNLRHARDLGINVIADPVLSPPLMGLARSISGYLQFCQAHPGVPAFFGAGNVTELIDADSQGANAILAAIGSEVGAAILFTPEYSDKARGAVRELRVSSEMMALAMARKSPPKDLGLDLLVLKEKRRRPDLLVPHQPVLAKCDHQFEADPGGEISIGIWKGQIVARHGPLEVLGAKARDVLNTLIDRGLVTRLDHAGYLGRELEKAEIALTLGKSYCQDEPLFGDRP
ncbi:MAG TPA: dihydropteroate synthase-like protein [Methanotrichaceae archaeon]|nr:dihydropteroate synthase-like protein [Methanotrichaceae archaeon]